MRIILIEKEVPYIEEIKRLLIEDNNYGTTFQIKVFFDIKEESLIMRFKEADLILLSIDNIEKNRLISWFNELSFSFPNIPIILLGKEELEESMIELLKYGAQSYIIKKDKKINLKLLVLIKKVIQNNKLLQEIKESKRNLELILNSFPGFIYWEDIEGNILGNNKKFNELKNILKDNFNFSSLNEIFTNEYSKKIDKFVIENGHPIIDIEEKYTFGNTEFYLKKSRFPIKEGDEIKGIFVILEDITENIKNINKIKKYDQVMNYIPVAVAFISKNGKLENFNKYFLNLFDYQTFEVIQESIFKFFKDKENISNLLNEFEKSSEKNIEIETNFLKKDGTEFIGRVKISKIYDLDNNFIFYSTFIEDITENVNYKKTIEFSNKVSKILNEISLNFLTNIITKKEVYFALDKIANVFRFCRMNLFELKEDEENKKYLERKYLFSCKNLNIDEKDIDYLLKTEFIKEQILENIINYKKILIINSDDNYKNKVPEFINFMKKHNINKTFFIPISTLTKNWGLLVCHQTKDNLVCHQTKDNKDFFLVNDNTMELLNLVSKILGIAILNSTDEQNKILSKLLDNTNNLKTKIEDLTKKETKYRTNKRLESE